jgi:hypothetical protein
MKLSRNKRIHEDEDDNDIFLSDSDTKAPNKHVRVISEGGYDDDDNLDAPPDDDDDQEESDHAQYPDDAPPASAPIDSDDESNEARKTIGDDDDAERDEDSDGGDDDDGGASDEEAPRPTVVTKGNKYLAAGKSLIRSETKVGRTKRDKTKKTAAKKDTEYSRTVRELMTKTSDPVELSILQKNLESDESSGEQSSDENEDDVPNEEDTRWQEKNVVADNDKSIVKAHGSVANKLRRQKHAEDDEEHHTTVSGVTAKMLTAPSMRNAATIGGLSDFEAHMDAPDNQDHLETLNDVIKDNVNALISASIQLYNGQEPSVSSESVLSRIIAANSDLAEMTTKCAEGMQCLGRLKLVYASWVRSFCPLSDFVRKVLGLYYPLKSCPPHEHSRIESLGSSFYAKVTLPMCTVDFLSGAAIQPHRTTFLMKTSKDTLAPIESYLVTTSVDAIVLCKILARLVVGTSAMHVAVGLALDELELSKSRRQDHRKCMDALVINKPLVYLARDIINGMMRVEELYSIYKKSQATGTHKPF